jgi:hypothetical protein
MLASLQGGHLHSRQRPLRDGGLGWCSDGSSRTFPCSTRLAIDDCFPKSKGPLELFDCTVFRASIFSAHHQPFIVLQGCKKALGALGLLDPAKREDNQAWVCATTSGVPLENLEAANKAGVALVYYSILNL